MMTPFPELNTNTLCGWDGRLKSEPVYKTKSKAVLMPDIIELVCERMNITQMVVVGKPRTQEIVQARQVIVYLCRECLGRSYPEIGKALNRHHTSIMALRRNFFERRDFYPALYKDVMRMKRVIDKKLR